jgi:pSer/pThr/pTyr-binding forkhead associated (FHA) protein
VYQEGVQEIFQNGGTIRIIKDAIKNAHIPPAVRAFHALGEDEQLIELHKMSPPEVQTYLPHASKRAQIAFIHGDTGE